jgi:hypothetical protein
MIHFQSGSSINWSDSEVKLFSLTSPGFYDNQERTCVVVYISYFTMRIFLLSLDLIPYLQRLGFVEVDKLVVAKLLTDSQLMQKRIR